MNIEDQMTGAEFESYSEFTDRIGVTSPIIKAKAIAMDRGLHLVADSAEGIREALTEMRALAIQMKEIESIAA